MQEIASEADLSTGALYRYFESKEAIVEALAAASAERRSEALDALKAGGGSGALADVVSKMMSALEGPGAEASARLDVRLWAEALDNDEIANLVRKAFASLCEPVTEFIRAEREAGRIRWEIDPEPVGWVVVSLMAGLELQRGHGRAERLESYSEVVRTLLIGLAPNGS